MHFRTHGMGEDKRQKQAGLLVNRLSLMADLSNSSSSSTNPSFVFFSKYASLDLSAFTWGLSLSYGIVIPATISSGRSLHNKE